MPFCEFAPSFAMFDVTPVENLFIEEYMLRAPGDYVKVYIYALKLCYHPGHDVSIASIAKALGMEEAAVLGAFAYWERNGLVKKAADKPPLYIFSNIKELTINSTASAVEDSLPYRAFNNALQDLFGERLLRAPEYQRFYDLMDVYKLPEEVVILLTRHVISKDARHEKAAISHFEKEAKAWNDKHIHSLTEAEEYLHTLSARYQGAQGVLKQFGLRRSPTVDEEQLYDRWTREWGFDQEAILLACKETTKITNPSFAYVDAVLRNKHSQKAVTAEAMRKKESERAEAFAPVREVLGELGAVKGAPTADLAALYKTWIEQGFDHACVLMAAKTVRRRGGDSMQAVDRQLSTWAKQGLFTPAAVEVFVNKRKAVNEALYAIFRQAGISRTPTEKDREALTRWQAQGAGQELLNLAAEYARHADNPFAYMDKVLSDWLAKGVQSPDDAKKAGEEKAAARQESRAAAPAQHFPQRSYSSTELDALYTDLDTLMEEEKGS